MQEQTESNFTPNESLQVIASMIEKVQNDKLRKLARKRVGFKLSLTIAVLLNAAVIIIWYLTTGVHSYFWPMWSLIGWFIVLLITYLDAYLGTTFFSEDKEYERLKIQTKNSNK